MSNFITHCDGARNYSPPSTKSSNNFIKINYPTISYITGTNKLSASEKIYYLVNEFYINMLRSWGNKQVSFSATKIGNLLGLSKTRVFSIQKKLEEKGYLLIKRSVDKNGRNNVNAPTTTLPKDVFLQLTKNNINLKNDLNESEKQGDIDPVDRQKLINSSSLYIPVDVEMAKLVFFHQDLSANSKLVFVKLLSVIHKIKQKNKYSLYAGALDLRRIEKEMNISASTLRRAINQLEEKGVIKKQKIRVKSDEACSNQFNKLVHYFEIPHLNEKIQSQMDPQIVTDGPSKYTYKNKNREYRSNFSNCNSENEQIKKLSDFYPLGEETCNLLRKTSQREFTTNAINEILLSMSKKTNKQPEFKTTNGFISYMSKALQYEMRDAVKTSNTNFKINRNISQREREDREREEYLQNIENSTNPDKYNTFRRKIASTMEADIAYSFLKSCLQVKTQEKAEDKIRFKLLLKDKINLSEPQSRILLETLRNVYLDRSETESSLELEAIRARPSLEDAEKEDNIKSKEQKWQQAVEKISRKLCSNSKHFIKNWFTRMETTYEESSNQLLLKPSEQFTYDYVKGSSVFSDIINRAEEEGIKLELCSIEAKHQDCSQMQS